jgi:beta-N-acetylglucosaminidase
VAEKLDPNEIVNFKELLMANSIQVDAIAQLLIEKGIFTKQEFFDMLKKVQMDYQRRKNNPENNSS